MEPAVTLKSAHGATTLEFFEREGDCFFVRVKGLAFEGTTRVYIHEPEYLKAFFADLTANWKGWAGNKEWASLEGELALSATMDKTGHVSLMVHLQSSIGDEWTLSAKLDLEAGQLERIAQSVAAFVDGLGD
jgi:hypothetical protein